MKRIFISIMLIISMASLVYATSEWDKTKPQSTDQKINYPTDAQANNEALDRLLSQYPDGITISYSSGSTLIASAGGVVCSNTAGTVRKFRNNTSTTNVTFSDLDTGSEASSTTYYVYANCDASASTATFTISASSTAPTGVTYYSQIGSFYNNASSDMTLVNSYDFVTADGTVSDGGTIPLPTGFTEGQCDWIVSTSSPTSDAGTSDAIRDMKFTASSTSSRVVTCKRTRIYGSTSEDISNVCNYLIRCAK